MILKNNKGSEREFKLLFKIDNNDKTYLVYKDKITGKIYGGRKEDKKLNSLNEEEEKLLNNILERINGEKN